VIHDRDLNRWLISALYD